MTRAGFHPLRVSRVDQLTADSAAITFDVPAALENTFDFKAGQSLTVRRPDGNGQRRSYSICAPVGQRPRIGVREVAGGAISGWLVHQVQPGDVVDATAPSGTFTPELTTPARHVLIAAGSGITPVLSIASSVLAATAESTVTLIYGNRRSDSVMFIDDVADLKDTHPDRMQLVHVLSREPQEVELYTGRLDAARLRALLPATVDIAAIDHWWLCGPFGMISDAQAVLSEFGVQRQRIHRELYYVEDLAPPPKTHVDPAAGPGATATVILDGRTSVVTVPTGMAVLDAAQRARPDLPFACKGGVCGTCRARLTRGSAEMRRNFALEEDEVAAGYVLTCQARPTSDELTVDYDA